MKLIQFGKTSFPELYEPAHAMEEHYMQKIYPKEQQQAADAERAAADEERDQRGPEGNHQLQQVGELAGEEKLKRTCGCGALEAFGEWLWRLFGLGAGVEQNEGPRVTSRATLGQALRRNDPRLSGTLFGIPARTSAVSTCGWECLSFRM